MTSDFEQNQVDTKSKTKYKEFFLSLLLYSDRQIYYNQAHLIFVTVQKKMLSIHPERQMRAFFNCNYSYTTP